MQQTTLTLNTDPDPAQSRRELDKLRASFSPGTCKGRQVLDVLDKYSKLIMSAVQLDANTANRLDLAVAALRQPRDALVRGMISDWLARHKY